MNGIAITTPAEEFAERLHQLYGPMANGNSRYWRDGLQMADLSDLAEEILRTQPRVVVIGPGLNEQAALQLIATFDQRSPGLVTVMVAEPSAELWPAAVRAGVRDVIAPDVADPELKEAMDRALHAAELRQKSFSAAADPKTRSRVISVISPKGGSGKTTTATNLAVGLAKLAPGEVVLIDLDLQFGSVAGALRLVPEHSVADAAHAGSALDTAMLKVFLSAHPLGLFTLCAPEALAQADDVGPEQLSRIVSLLSDNFRYVIIDTAAGINVVTVAAVELSTDLVLISTTDVSCVRALRRAMDALDTLGMNSQVRHFVLNRADAKGGLSLADIQSVTGAEVDVAIPDSRAVALSLNLGTPILDSDPKSPPGKALAELVGPFARSQVDAETVTGPHGGRRISRRGKERT